MIAAKHNVFFSFLSQQVHLRYTSKAFAAVCSISMSCLNLSKDLHGACTLLLQPPGCAL